MKKKLLCVLLALVLALSCAVSLAETTDSKTSLGTIDINGAFELRCALPEGYEVTPLSSDNGQVLAMIVPQDAKKPSMTLSVAFDETYADVERMNDLDQEALSWLEGTFTDDSVEISYGETGHGTKLLIASQRTDDPNFVDFLSIYKGYFIECVLTPSEEAEGGVLTDEQVALCVDFLTELDFVEPSDPAEAANEEAKDIFEDFLDFLFKENGDETKAEPQEQEMDLDTLLSLMLSSVEETADQEASPEQQELETVGLWLSSTVPEASAEEMLDWDLDTIKEKLKDYDGELKYHTLDEIAEDLYGQISLMNMLKALGEALGSGIEDGPMGDVIEPVFNSTFWVSDSCALHISLADGEYTGEGLYLVRACPTMDDLNNGVNESKYLCTLDEETWRILTSTGTGLSETDQKDQGLGSTFSIVEEAIQHDDELDLDITVPVLVWKNADGEEIRLEQFNPHYVGKFQSDDGYVMEVAWQDGYYKMALAKSWEAIENGGEDVLEYLAYQQTDGANLNGLYNEENPQEDHGSCYFYNDPDFAPDAYEFSNGLMAISFNRIKE